MKRGAHFIHEHPWGAKSWNLECMRPLIHHDKVMIVKVDLCRFGLTTTDSKGEEGPARKRSEFMSTSWAVVEELDGVCNGTNQKHNPLIDGRARNAAIYPP